MRKISIEVINNTLVFSYLFIDPSILSVTIDNHQKDGLVFSEEYINNNNRIFMPFIKEYLLSKDIRTIIVNDLDLINLVLKIIKNLPKKVSLVINTNDFIKNTLVERIILATNISKLSAYNMEFKSFEYLNSCKIKTELQIEELPISDFAVDNNLKNKQSIYTKEDVKIIHNIGENDLKDFENFCKLNKSLKNVYLYGFPNKNCADIFDNVDFNYLNDIKVSLYVDSNNIDAFQKSIKNIKELTKKYKKNKKLNFEIVYSEEYIQENYLKQLSWVTLKTCSIIALVFTFSICGLLAYNNYNAKNDIDKLKNIAKEIDLLEEEVDSDNLDEQENIDAEKNEKISLAEDYSKLIEINPETVGWLKVPGTDVNYPVVQTNNNDYYLSKSFYKKNNYQGWIFVDYKNDLSKKDQNVIIYGHNGIMFGSLHKALKPAWYKNEENYIITFNSIYEKGQYHVVSIYKTDTQFDYIVTNYNQTEEYVDFISEIKRRSLYDFGVEITADDQILTLSTCIDNGINRVVIHAKRIS